MTNFTVLLSIYKNENPSCLNDSLTSVIINQTIIPNEVVIIKDGLLTNELDEMILLWKKTYNELIKIITLKDNVGLGQALNEGLKYCSNEWVFRMDTDDYCIPDRFERQLSYINLNPNISLLGSYTEEFDATLSKSLGYRTVPILHNEIIKYVKKRNPFNHMTVAFRKEVIQSVGGYRHHLYMEDYNLWIRVIAAGYYVGNIDDVLVKVRGGDSMIKRRKGIKYIKSEFLLAKLKIDKKIDTPFNSYLIFVLRSIPRLLPISLLSMTYKKLRK